MSTPFNIEEYRAARQVEVLLPSCGMTATVRPVNLVEVLNQMRLHPGAMEQLKQAKAAGEQVEEMTAESALAQFADFYDLSCAIAIAACVSPPLSIQPEDGKLHVYELHPGDVDAILAPVLAELGLTKEGLRTIAPFHQPGDATEPQPALGQTAE